MIIIIIDFLIIIITIIININDNNKWGLSKTKGHFVWWKKNTEHKKHVMKKNE